MMDEREIPIIVNYGMLATSGQVQSFLIQEILFLQRGQRLPGRALISQVIHFCLA